AVAVLVQGAAQVAEAVWEAHMAGLHALRLRDAAAAPETPAAAVFVGQGNPPRRLERGGKTLGVCGPVVEQFRRKREVADGEVQKAEKLFRVVQCYACGRDGCVERKRYFCRAGASLASGDGNLVVMVADLNIESFQR